MLLPPYNTPCGPFSTSIRSISPKREEASLKELHVVQIKPNTLRHAVSSEPTDGHIRVAIRPHGEIEVRYGESNLIQAFDVSPFYLNCGDRERGFKR
jgi:hypothetical protein